MSGDRMLGDAWVLVVEAEDRLRHDLVSLLGETAADLGAVIPASSAGQAQSLCQAWCAPAVAFLDIQLPGRTGLDLLQTLPACTRVVFITAYDRFVLDALDRGAVDYLLKPVAAERLQRCLSRLRSRAVPAVQAAREILSSLTATRPAQPVKWLAASSGRHTRLIAVDDITYLQSDNPYTRIVTKDGEHLLEESVKSLMPRLDLANFCQIHESTAVHLREVLLVEKDDTGSGLLHLRSRPEVLRISAPFMREFKRFLV